MRLIINLSKEKKFRQKIPIIGNWLFGDKANSFIDASLSISKIKVDFPKVTPIVDSISNITTYKLKIIPNENVSEFIFEFIPNDAGEVSMDLIFDDNVSDKFDKTIILNFVE